MRSRGFIAAGLIAALAGCATDTKTTTAGPTGHVRLSADREPFTFSSWDVGRVEWTAPPADPAAVPPHVAAVLADGTALPLRELTLTKARATKGLTVSPPTKLDDRHGGFYATVTPVTGSGFTFAFVGDRLVHFAAAGYDRDGSPSEPVFHALDVDRTDSYGDVKQYALPLGRQECVDLFGQTSGLETDLSLPSILP